ncbi:MAG: lysostaphin resistance A-like protein [Thermoguttaceae bacterium]
METHSTDSSSISWNGWDVCFIFLLWSFLGGFCIFCLSAASENNTPNLAAPKIIENESIQIQLPKKSPEHVLTRLLTEGKNSPAILILAFFCAVISAPLTEEFLFRLVFQGWLETKIRWAAILVSSLVFSLIHGAPRHEMAFSEMTVLFSGGLIANTILVILGIGYLRFFRGATFQELGWNRHFLARDIFDAVVTFLCLAPILFSLHIFMRIVLPEYVTDPIPLFVFASVLGFQYYSTHRLAPCVVLHALLNGCSFILVLLLLP